MKMNHTLLSIGAVLVTLTAAAQLQPPPTRPPRHVEGELLVKFVGGPRGAAAERTRGRMKHEVKRHFDFVGWQHIRLPRGMTVEEGLAHYRNLPGVEAVEPNGIGQLVEPAPVAPAFQPASAAGPTMPNDPMFPQQWGLTKIGVTNAWSVTTGSSNVVVAVIDTGINYLHEDLAANMWRNPGEIPGNGLDDDGNGFVDDVYGIDTADDPFGNDSDPMDQGLNGYYHGSACAGVIGATSDNGKGITGVNWSVRLLSVRCVRADDTVSIADHIQALDYIILMKQRGVNLRVVNMSFGTGFGFSQAQKDAMDAVAAQGIVQVAAVGNAGADNDVVPVYPASQTTSNLIAVAASDQSDGLAMFPSWSSNFGRTNVDLAAPGTAVPTCFGPGTNSYISSFGGTSAAAPHVAGAAALLFAMNPNATADDVKSALLESVDQLPAFTNRMVSHGRLNLGRAALHPLIAAGSPRILNQPQQLTVVLSNRAVLRMEVGGSRPFIYQWHFNGLPLAGATNAQLVLDPVGFEMAGVYSLAVSNAMGSIHSDDIALTVLPLQITQHPTNQTVRLGSNATFAVSVQGPVTYQWFFNSEPIPDATNATLILSNTQFAHEGAYSVEAANLWARARSSNAYLVVLIDPRITIAPVSQSVVAGGSATFSVGFTGNPMPFGVEWRQGSIPQVSNTLSRFQDFFTLTNAQPSHAGTWRVIVRNLARNTTTGENRSFTLTVLPDTDGDGLPDVWESNYPTAGHGAEDTDLDGLTNLEEYRAGTDPTNASSYLKVDSVSLASEGAGARLTFRAASNNTYTVESRPAADSGAWSRVADVVAASSNRVVEVLDTTPPDANGQRYYRLATPRSP